MMYCEGWIGENVIELARTEYVIPGVLWDNGVGTFRTILLYKEVTETWPTPVWAQDDKRIYEICTAFLRNAGGCSQHSILRFSFEGQNVWNAWQEAQKKNLAQGKDENHYENVLKALYTCNALPISRTFYNDFISLIREWENG